MIPFHKRQVAVTLTGAQWRAILARLCSVPLSDKSRSEARVGGKKLGEQLITEAKRKDAWKAPELLARGESFGFSAAAEREHE